MLYCERDWCRHNPAKAATMEWCIIPAKNLHFLFINISLNTSLLNMQMEKWLNLSISMLRKGWMGTSITRKIKEYANIEVYGPYAPMGLKNSSWQPFRPALLHIQKYPKMDGIAWYYIVFNVTKKYPKIPLKIPKISTFKRVFCPASVTSRFCIRESFLEETRIVQKQEKKKII